MPFIIALFNGVSEIFGGMISALWTNLPALLQLKETMEMFTPESLLAVVLGVPSVVIAIIIIIIKKIFS